MAAVEAAAFMEGAVVEDSMEVSTAAFTAAGVMAASFGTADITMGMVLGTAFTDTRGGDGVITAAVITAAAMTPTIRTKGATTTIRVRVNLRQTAGAPLNSIARERFKRLLRGGDITAGGSTE